MENVKNVFIQAIDKPERKVIIKRGVKAEDYLPYCEEVGCDVWGPLTSVKSLCGEPVSSTHLDVYKRQIQKMRFGLPLLPTTTIGSFPQTKEVRANRSAYKKGQIDERQYQEFNCRKIEECIRLQAVSYTHLEKRCFCERPEGYETEGRIVRCFQYA